MLLTNDIAVKRDVHILNPLNQKNMKLKIISILMISLLFSCNDKENKEEMVDENVSEVEQMETPTNTSTETEKINEAVEEKEIALTDAVFDINKIPVTKANLGDFPFFKLPNGYNYANEKSKDFDREYFLINGNYHKVDGKGFKADVRADRSQNKDFSQLELSASFDQLIKSLGGVKVNNEVQPTKEALDLVGKSEIAKGFTYSSGLYKDSSTYVIRTKDAEIWVQLKLDSANGDIAIFQKGELNNTMNTMTSDDLKKT